MIEFLPYLGYLIAIIMTVLAFFAWQKAVHLKTLLVENANLFKQGKEHNQRLMADHQKLESKFSESRDAIKRLEKELADMRVKYGSVNRRNEQLQTRMNEIDRDVERRTEHLVAQVEAITAQARDADTGRKAMERELERNLKDRDRLVQDARVPLEQELDKLKQKLRDASQTNKALETELKALHRQAEGVDPQEVKRLKRRVIHLEHLYSSMKGLKEMAEERNENWEAALRILSTSVLERASKRSSTIAQNSIGSLVGAALESLGAQLMNDHDDSATPQADAELRSSANDALSPMTTRPDSQKTDEPQTASSELT